MATMLGLTPQQKAALVVAGLPAPAGVAGVIVQKYDRNAPRPRGAFVVTDQEGGKVETLPQLPPRSAARAVRGKAEAFDSGRATGRALRRIGVDVDLAPVLDLPDGPLGSRQFRSPFFGVAFARGLAAGGAGACVKHFPGLGSLPFSTDEQKALRDLAHDFAEREIRPKEREYDEGSIHPANVIAKAHGLGLMNVHIPEAYGGLELGAFEGMLIGEEL